MGPRPAIKVSLEPGRASVMGGCVVWGGVVGGWGFVRGGFGGGGGGGGGGGWWGFGGGGWGGEWKRKDSYLDNPEGRRNHVHSGSRSAAVGVAGKRLKEEEGESTRRRGPLEGWKGRKGLLSSPHQAGAGERQFISRPARPTSSNRA